MERTSRSGQQTDARYFFKLVVTQNGTLQQQGRDRVTEKTRTTWRLEMQDASEARPKHVSIPNLEIRQVVEPCPEFNWFLHQAVGTEFLWGGRQAWTEAEWAEFVSRRGMETWVAYVAGAPAGYFEMQKLNDGSVRIHSFGLLRRHFGIGLGAHLLTYAIQRGWNLGAVKLWLTTCSHDHPHALQNYQARGFRIVEQRTDPANQPRPSVIFTSG